jgi:hypothetical protein
MRSWSAWSTASAERSEENTKMLLLGMILLGLATFAAMLAFVHMCDRV